MCSSDLSPHFLACLSLAAFSAVAGSTGRIKHRDIIIFAIESALSSPLAESAYLCKVYHTDENVAVTVNIAGNLPAGFTAIEVLNPAP